MERILIIDDDPGICESLRLRFEESGHSVISAATGAQGIETAADSNLEVVFLDLVLPDTNGLDVLRAIKARRPELSVIIITGMKDLSQTIQAMKWGAEDFIFKPLDIHQIDIALLKIRRLKQLEQQANGYRISPIEPVGDGSIIGQSPAIVEICKSIGRIANSRFNVLIQGETGTGKELVARAIHFSASNKDEPLVAINCSALVETLIESELFGYERGAFTGAVTRRVGKLELAHGGTFFLDEIGDMPLTLQAKLLRVIEEKRFERVGSNVPIQADVRFISATNKNLQQMTRDGAFRQDLLHRLNVINLFIPPLRERKEDIPLLVNHILRRLQRELHKPLRLAGSDVLHALLDYNWPGNARELENILSQAAVLSAEGFITRENLMFGPPHDAFDKPAPRPLPLKDMERDHIRMVLSLTGGNITRACELLKITRPTLRRKIKEYGLAVVGFARAGSPS